MTINYINIFKIRKRISTSPCHNQWQPFLVLLTKTMSSSASLLFIHLCYLNMDFLNCWHAKKKIFLTRLRTQSKEIIFNQNYKFLHLNKQSSFIKCSANWTVQVLLLLPTLSPKYKNSIKIWMMLIFPQYLWGSKLPLLTIILFLILPRISQMEMLVTMRACKYWSKSLNQNIWLVYQWLLLRETNTLTCHIVNNK